MSDTPKIMKKAVNAFQCPFITTRSGLNVTNTNRLRSLILTQTIHNQDAPVNKTVVSPCFIYEHAEDFRSVVDATGSFNISAAARLQENPSCHCTDLHNCQRM